MSGSRPQDNAQRGNTLPKNTPTSATASPATAGSTAVIAGAMSDPWAHRSLGMRCMTCMFFATKVKSDGSPSPLGRCRASQPTMKGFPAVFTTDWCGNHKLDENRI